MTAPLTNLLDFDPHSWSRIAGELGEKPFRAKQLQRWIHQLARTIFNEMTDLAKSLREKVVGRAQIIAPAAISDHTSSDGTEKWLVDVGNGMPSRFVFIPEENAEPCVFPPAGCAVNCRFCSTGKQGFNRKSSVSEIIITALDG